MPKSAVKRSQQRVLKARVKVSFKRSAGGFYPSYHFQLYDPILDIFQLAFERSSLKVAEVHRSSGVSVTTIDNYLGKKVRSPRHSTLSALFRALGAKEYVRIGTVSYLVEGNK